MIGSELGAKARSRNSGRTTVLLTGFGPFPLMPRNATMDLVPAVTKQARQSMPDVVFVSEILPTEWMAAPARLKALLAEIEPDVSIHFGVSPRARGFEIETRAVNVCAPLADASGALPIQDCIDSDGPDELNTQLPATHIVNRLRRLSIPAHLSRDAGTYLCNAALYTTLDAILSGGLNGLGGTKGGFVHIPARGVAKTPRLPSTASLGATGAIRLNWTQAVIGGVEIVAACLGRASRPVVAGRGSGHRGLVNGNPARPPQMRRI
jgi:pyroglutamyl-peptidase